MKDFSFRETEEKLRSWFDEAHHERYGFIRI
jgi:hypothetical protein